jgi:hypothetical protein
LLLTVLLLALDGCSGEHQLVRVERRAVPAGIRLTLISAPGARINARLKPALETADGRVLRFDSRELTADSSYFVAAPTLDLTAPITGQVRASVCAKGERLCRTVVVEVRSEK